MWCCLISLSLTVQAIVAPMAFIGSPGSITTLHYASNSNFANGTYAPGQFGFNLADVSSPSDLSELPNGVSALVFLGMCGGADSSFVNTVQPFVGDSQVFGFYLMDDPDPTGEYGPICPPSHLKEEADWIHAHDPGARTFMVLMNLSSSKSPDYRHSYNPANSHVDLYGLDVYPCRTDVGGCAFKDIESAVTAAEKAHIPEQDIVPVYQAFGGGSYVDDSGGQYSLPTVAQTKRMIRTWATVVPDPAFDYTYSWGAQDGDSTLAGSTTLQGVFALHNMGVGGGYDFPPRRR